MARLGGLQTLMLMGIARPVVSNSTKIIERPNRIDSAKTLQQTIEHMTNLGHKIFATPEKKYNLNIVGFRTREPVADEFKCWLSVFWLDKTMGWVWYTWPITTLPGKPWLRNPMVWKGCAIMAPGQYQGCYSLGTHLGQYRALCQHGPVTVYRDNNRDDKHDFQPNHRERGIFGLNFHRANPKGITNKVNTWSAGCQVFQRAEHFNDFIWLCEQSAKQWMNYFTYTLLA